MCLTKIQGQLTLVFHKVPCVGCRLSHFIGNTMAKKHKVVVSTYHQCVKTRLGMNLVQIATNPTLFDHLEILYAYAEFNTALDDNLKPIGTPLLPWEDIKNLRDDDLRWAINEQKKKISYSSDNTSASKSKCSKIILLDGKVVYCLWYCAELDHDKWDGLKDIYNILCMSLNQSINEQKLRKKSTVVHL